MEKSLCAESPLGVLTLTERDGWIVRLTFGRMDAAQASSEVLERAARQLKAYFDGTLREFDLPLAPEGTPFCRSVWQALCRVPYGQTRSYAQLARAVGRDKACRAVGRANHMNPIPVLIPCHRVIGADGRPRGYAGGEERQRTLLRLEGIEI